MDNKKIGQFILDRRKELCLTQKDLASKLNVSEQAVSKWERGLGCPDISIIEPISEILGVHLQVLMKGEIEENKKDNGNMKKLRFYVCKECGNVITSTSKLNSVCCGRILEELTAVKHMEEHDIIIEDIDGDYYVSVNHPMEKEHFISFIAYVTCNKASITKLYPQQQGITNFRKVGHGLLYAYCNLHGLSYQLI